jgi:hypothetical protein
MGWAFRSVDRKNLLEEVMILILHPMVLLNAASLITACRFIICFCSVYVFMFFLLGSGNPGSLNRALSLWIPFLHRYVRQIDERSSTAVYFRRNDDKPGNTGNVWGLSM